MMTYLRNIKTIGKITLLIGFMAVMLAAVGYVGHYAAQTLSEKMDIMYTDRLRPIEWLGEARAESRRNEAVTLALFLAKDDKELQQTQLKKIDEHKKLYASYLEQYQQTNLDPKEKGALSAVGAGDTGLSDSLAEVTGYGRGRAG